MRIYTVFQAGGFPGTLLSGRPRHAAWPFRIRDRRGFIRAGHGWGPVQPTVVVNVACFDTDEEAWDVIKRHSVEAQDSVVRHYQWRETERFRETKGYEQYAKFSEITNAKPIDEIGEHAARPQAWGSPDRVLEKLRHIQETTSAEEMVFNFRFGAMPVEVAERSMRLFSAQVLDRFHAMPAELHMDMAGSSAP